MISEGHTKILGLRLELLHFCTVMSRSDGLEIVIYNYEETEESCLQADYNPDNISEDRIRKSCG